MYSPLRINQEWNEDEGSGGVDINKLILGRRREKIRERIKDQEQEQRKEAKQAVINLIQAVRDQRIKEKELLMQKQKIELERSKLINIEQDKERGKGVGKEMEREKLKEEQELKEKEQRNEIINQKIAEIEQKLKEDKIKEQKQSKRLKFIQSTKRKRQDYFGNVYNVSGVIGSNEYEYEIEQGKEMEDEKGIDEEVMKLIIEKGENGDYTQLYNYLEQKKKNNNKDDQYAEEEFNSPKQKAIISYVARNGVGSKVGFVNEVIVDDSYKIQRPHSAQPQLLSYQKHHGNDTLAHRHHRIPPFTAHSLSYILSLPEQLRISPMNAEPPPLPLSKIKNTIQQNGNIGDYTNIEQQQRQQEDNLRQSQLDTLFKENSKYRLSDQNKHSEKVSSHDLPQNSPPPKLYKNIDSN
ncbi:MAG: hypothetical protein EZS28_020830 [Streblomastix strix]|uniref:Uncharacterized protein n=1 Tax=Streblomastix strix TaxID=222440 RepID=A0A5J4VN00_9EUKA|nr:MAG: hypothetical protein EZS28_020830 [Streblomastix strix]